VAAIIAGIGVSVAEGDPEEEVRAGQVDQAQEPVPTSITSPTGDEWPEGWVTSSTLPTEPLPSPDEVARARLAALEVLGLGPDGSGTNDVVLGSSNLIPAGGTDDSRRITLELRADGWPIAQDITTAVGAGLRARSIDITVGNRSFPTGSPVGNPASPIVIEPARGGGQVPALSARIELESDTVASGTNLSGRVVAFATESPVTYETGVSEIGFVVERGTTSVVGTWPGVMPSLGKTVDIERSGTVLDLVAGTTRCRREGPPGLAPGAYDLVWGLSPTDLTDPVTIIARTPITVTG
jgi:hypothetical protein